MRFRIDLEVCVEADSVEELEALADGIEIAAAQSAGARIAHHPTERWISGFSLEGLDDESEAALRADGRWLSAPACDLADESSGGDGR